MHRDLYFTKGNDDMHRVLYFTKGNDDMHTAQRFIEKKLPQRASMNDGTTLS